MSHTIIVERKKTKGTGTLTYKSGTLSVRTPCWFEIVNPIRAKKYVQCSATFMARKLNSAGGPREAVYLPDTQTGRRGIFIHRGTSQAWSNGCIVAAEAEVQKIWKNINPKDGQNVIVEVKDV